MTFAKKLFLTLVAPNLLTTFFGVGMQLAAQTNDSNGDGIILPEGVNKDSLKKIKTQMKDAWACVKVDEPLSWQVEKVLYKDFHQRKFILPGRPCWAPGRTVVVYSLGSTAESVPVNGNGFASAYSHSGSFSEGISQNGNEWTAHAYATLVTADGVSQRIGDGRGTAFAGYAYSYASSSGRRYGASANTNTTTPDAVAIAAADIKAMMALIHPHGTPRKVAGALLPFFTSPDSDSEWNPSAAERVRASRRQPSQ